jgi:hypothetical protein
MEKVAAACILLCSAAARAQERAEHVLPALTNDVALAAEWQGEYRLDVAAGPGGVVEGTPSGWHPEATMVSNRAVADRTYRFAGWTGVPEGMEADNPLVFGLCHAHTNVVAGFEPNVLTPGGAEGGLPSFGVPTFPPGSAVSVERTGSLDKPDWQPVGALAGGETNWIDEYPPAAWEQLYYRLAQ